MRRAAVTAWMLAAGCAAQPLRPSTFDPSNGTALVALGPGAGADRLDAGKWLRLLGVRDAAGTTVLGAAARDQCTLTPIELSPGRYMLEVERCTSTCTGARFDVPLEAHAGHDYRIEIDKALLSLQLVVTEWEAFVVDETADAARSAGKAVERCH